MDHSREELEQRAAKARLLARQIGDKQASEGILELARELEKQANQQSK
jgi:hypothetical protein